MSQLMLDRAGRRRSPATMPRFHAGQAPGNKGHLYPADPPKVEEIVAVMRAAGDRPHGRRMRALIVILWRAGLRINEALELAAGDLDEARGALLVRRGKGGRQREVGVDGWAWEKLQQPPHARSCGASPPQPACADAFAPHQLRHAHAVEMAREDVPLIIIQRQLAHSDLGITSVYLQGIRQRRNHRHRSRPARADGAGEHLPATVRRRAGNARGPVPSPFLVA